MYVPNLSGLCRRDIRTCSLSCERQAVGALIDFRIAFMAANFDLVQRAIVLQIAMVGTLTDGAFNCFICIGIHLVIPLFKITGLVCTKVLKTHLYFYGKIKPEAFTCLRFISLIVLPISSLPFQEQPERHVQSDLFQFDGTFQ